MDQWIPLSILSMIAYEWGTLSPSTSKHGLCRVIISQNVIAKLTNTNKLNNARIPRKHIIHHKTGNFIGNISHQPNKSQNLKTQKFSDCWNLNDRKYSKHFDTRASQCSTLVSFSQDSTQNRSIFCKEQWSDGRYFPGQVANNNTIFNY